MILNILIIAFVLAVAYWSAMQGLFSSLLHLAMVIAAGALALAVWEPITLAFLLGFKPAIAWGLGLVVPFAVILLVLRLVSDKLVPANVNVIHLADLLGGGGLGALAGILTAGVTLIGVGFLPFGPSLGGHQPYSPDRYGQVTATDSALWLAVDRWAFGFYEMLASHGGWSGGAFTSGAPLAQYQPDLAKQAALVRLRPDPFSSVAATPEAVNVETVLTQRWPEVTGPAKKPLQPAVTAVAARGDVATNAVNRKLVVVETKWEKTAGVYDTDSKLRVPPSQIRLIANREDAGAGIDTHAPLGFVRVNPTKDNARFVYLFEGADAAAHGRLPNETLAWIFAVPKDQTPRHMLVRHLRLTLPETDAFETHPDAVTEALGQPAPEPKEDQDADEQGKKPAAPAEGQYPGAPEATWIEATSDLPGAQLSSNNLGMLDLSGNAITGGKQTVKGGSDDYVDADVRVDRIQHATVRMKLSAERADSLIGSALSAAGQVSLIHLTDAQGNRYYAHGYVLQKGDGQRTIEVRSSDNEFKRATDLPRWADDDTLYLYFQVPTGITLEQFRYGQNQTQALDWTVPESVNQFKPPDE
jgi:hypothetical protein